MTTKDQYKGLTENSSVAELQSNIDTGVVDCDHLRYV